MLVKLFECLNTTLLDDLVSFQRDVEQIISDSKWNSLKYYEQTSLVELYYVYIKCQELGINVQAPDFMTSYKKNKPATVQRKKIKKKPNKQHNLYVDHSTSTNTTTNTTKQKNIANVDASTKKTSKRSVLSVDHTTSTNTTTNTTKKKSKRSVFRTNEERIEKTRLRKKLNKGPSVDCEYCKKTLKNKYSYKLHLYQHNGKDKPHKCQICSKSYIKKNDLVCHVESIHCKISKFHCEKCDYGTSDSSAFKRHLLRHSGAKPVACDFCMFRCKRMDELKTHLKLRHNFIAQLG